MSIKTDRVEFLVTQEDFIELMDDNVKLQEQVAALEKNCAFFRCCALSGEQPEEGAEPYPKEDKT